MMVEKLQTHLETNRYGDFLLTDAIRPAPDLQIVPCEGYRAGIYSDASAKLEVPVLTAAVSGERLFEVFIDLLDPLGPLVDIVLETSHRSKNQGHSDLYREGIDAPVLMSHLWDHEDLLLNDGCTGIAVISRGYRMEVQFDEHKLLVIYAYDLRPFERVLKAHGVRRNNRLRLLTESEHLHSTLPHYCEEFEQLCYQLGAVDSGREPWILSNS